MNKFSLLILCAGFGRRMLELTRNIPKPLLKVNNKTLLSNTINFFSDIGCNEFFINTHYLHNKIKTYVSKNFENYPLNIIYEPTECHYPRPPSRRAPRQCISCMRVPANPWPST